MYKIGIIIYKLIFGSVKTSRGKETLESFQTNEKENPGIKIQCQENYEYNPEK